MPTEILEVRRKYNITLKKSLRKALGIEPGRLLIAEVQGDSLSLRPLPRDPFQRLDDLLGGMSKSNLTGLAETQAVSEARSSLEKKAPQEPGD